MTFVWDLCTGIPVIAIDPGFNARRKSVPSHSLYLFRPVFEHLTVYL